MPCAPADAGAFERLRQQREQRGAEQRARGEAHEMRQHARARPIRQQQEDARDHDAEHAAERGEQEDRAERAQGRSDFVVLRQNASSAKRRRGS